eukprot:TRINITY_DN77486_c0_g1_i1.p1 TRINITY_DN77486_c0_g1~~TRINITY_DN77486_c0_g1_i1.p1  ORF type:complete len:423 (+),score=65.81 TRINITY_DN77486_c0_g1_i1:112-1269(+)
MCGYAGKVLFRKSGLMEKTHPVKSGVLFKIGFVLHNVCGPLIDIAAYSFAPQSLIAPFGGFDVVWNAMLGPYLLNEKLTKHRAVGSFLVLSGSVTASIFGNHHDPEYTVEDVERTLVNLRVLLYFVAFFAWFLVNRFYFYNFDKASLVRGISLGCLGGSLMGNMWCVKVAIEIVQTSIAHNDPEPWKTWIPYVALVGAAFFAVANARYMAIGLSQYPAFLMVPVIEGSMIMSASASGAIVMFDLNGLPAWRISLYALAIIVVLIGMYVIVRGEARSHSSLANGDADIEMKAERPPSPKSPSAADLARTISKDSNQSLQLRERIRSISHEDILNGTVKLGGADDVCIQLDDLPTKQLKEEGPAKVAPAVIGKEEPLRKLSSHSISL